MLKARLGRRGPEVSRVGFGAWAIGGTDWGPTDDTESRAAIHAALDAGVTLLDTADVYGRGHSEELIAGVLDERGSAGITVATKAGNDFYNASKNDDTGYGPIKSNADKAYIIFAAEQSLKRLRTDCLDLLQLHSHPLELLERDDPWDALEALKRQGKIRWAGWSVQSFQETAQAHLLDRHAELIDVIQVRYNLLEREAERVLFPKALEHGIGVIVRIPLLFGLLTGKFGPDAIFGPDDHRRFNLGPEKLPDLLRKLESLPWLFESFPDQSMAQVAMRFTITHPACQTVIPGGKTPAQVRDNSRAGELGPLPQEIVGRLEPLPAAVT